MIPSKRFPLWLKQEIPSRAGLINNRIRRFEDSGLHTVCQSARCPNLARCFAANTATLMILGADCSRSCAFCAVGKGALKAVDVSEPYRAALAIRDMALRYAVVTSVTRDDLALGGATQFARLAYFIRSFSPGVRIEFLIPDFKSDTRALSLLAAASPDVLAHNIETVERLYSTVRPQAQYGLSLSVFRKIKDLEFAGYLKSGIMLGLGEKEEEVIRTMDDLKDAGCDMLTLGQYLSPSPAHLPVSEFVSPEKFEYYRLKALALGFRAVWSGPLVRSSYQAEELYNAFR